MKTQIIVENVRVHVAERGVINQPDLKDIEFVFNGEVVDISPEELEEYAFTGLNNVDFVMDRDWENNKAAIEKFDDGPFNGIVPNNLDEAIATIIPQLTPANIQDIMHIKDEEKETAHGRSENLDMYMCLNGMKIRNDWRLWGDSPLAKWLADRGIYHADDMSGVICKAVWMNVKGLGEIDLKQEAEWYKQWWDRTEGGNEQVKKEFYERCK